MEGAQTSANRSLAFFAAGRSFRLGISKSMLILKSPEGANSPGLRNASSSAPGSPSGVCRVLVSSLSASPHLCGPHHWSEPPSSWIKSQILCSGAPEMPRTAFTQVPSISPVPTGHPGLLDDSHSGWGRGLSLRLQWESITRETPSLGPLIQGWSMPAVWHTF